MSARTRPATPSEAAGDRRKREAALEAGIAEGRLSSAQIERVRAVLETFAGYPRPIKPERRRPALAPVRLRVRFTAGRRS